MKSLFLLCLLMAFSLHALASEIKVAVITSQFDKNVSDFYLELNDKKEISGLRLITTMPNGGIFEDISTPAIDVLDDGADLVERNGYMVVRIGVENFSLKLGGTVVLDYLYNGATGNRQIKKLTLKVVDGKFTLFDGAKKINRLYLVVNYVRVLGAVGVREIQTSYKE